MLPTDAEDYQETQVEVLFPADATERTVVVTLVTDTDDDESEESFFGILTLPSGQMGVRLAQPQAVITIRNEAGASGAGGNETSGEYMLIYYSNCSTMPCNWIVEIDCNWICVKIQ